MFDLGPPPQFPRPAIILPRPAEIIRPGDPRFVVPKPKQGMFSLIHLGGFASIVSADLQVGTTGTFGVSELGSYQVNTDNPHGGLRWTSPASGFVAQVKVKAVAVFSAGYWQARLYTNNSGSPGTQIGSSSGAQTVNTDGANYTFVFASPPSISNGVTYWMVITPASGSPAFALSACEDQPAYGSGLAASITSITAWLGGELRMEITYLF
jgi:hypothetical protein